MVVVCFTVIVVCVFYCNSYVGDHCNSYVIVYCNGYVFTVVVMREHLFIVMDMCLL